MMLTPFALGPVELNIVSLDSDRPSPGVLAALATQLDAGTVSLVDFVIVTKTLSGDVSVSEVDPDEFGLAGLEMLAPGLTAEEDLTVLAERIPPGSSAAIVAFELSWARDLAERLAESGAVVVGTERIPAPVVNAILDAATDD